jgi:hypothetical protein
MKLPTPASRIKLLLVLVVSSVGCAAAVAEAPFPGRPGAVDPGDLHGPYDGQVLDADTGKPLAGAAVVGSWSLEDGVGLIGPEGAAWRRVETDADGRYRLEAFAGGRGRLARFTLLVYKRGYVAYRSDRRIEDASARHDFTQRENVVKLERFPEAMTHAAHLRYLGAGGPLLAELGPELQQASDERAGSASATVAAQSAPDATQLLAPDELKAVTGFEGRFEMRKLGDLPTTAHYDSAHYKAEGQPERFDAALRLWRLSPDEAERQYRKLLLEYPGAEERNEVGDRSLRAKEGEILAVAALDRTRGLVLVFTCGSGQCHDGDTVMGLVKRMWPRLERALAARAPAAEPEPTEKPPETETPPPAEHGPLRLKPPEFKP